MRSHADLKELLGVYDSLSPNEQEEVNGHLVGCAECRDELAAWRRMDRALRNLPDPPPGRAVQERVRAEVAAAAPAQSAFAVSKPRPSLPPEPHPKLVEAASLAESAPFNERRPFPWARLLVPATFALVFILSIWLTLRDSGRKPNVPVATPTLPAVLPGTPRPPTAEPPRVVTITFVCDATPEVLSQYAETARRFAAENPDVVVLVRSFRDVLDRATPPELDQLMMEGLTYRADAFCVHDVPALARGQYLYNLSRLMAGDPGFHPEDFYAATLDTVRYKQDYYAVPSEFQPALIRYDPAAFDAAGLAYPRPDWTWEDFSHAAAALTQRQQGKTQRWGFSEDPPILFNTRFASALSDPTFVAATRSSDPFSSSSVVNLFRWYDDLYLQQRAAAVPKYFRAETSITEPLFASQVEVSGGKAAMWTDLMYQNSRPAGKPAPLPGQSDEGGAPIFTAPAWAIAAWTGEPDAAWRWLNYLSYNPPILDQPGLPARSSLTRRLAFWNDLPADETDVYRYVLERLMNWPAAMQQPEVQALYENLQTMVTGKAALAGFLPRNAVALSPDAPAKPPLTFAVPRDQLIEYRQTAHGFEQESGINVSLVAREDLFDQKRPPDTTTLWAQMRQVANRADVLAGPDVVSLVRSGRSQGILYDLTSFVQRQLSPRDYYPNTLESLQWQGRAFALPARLGVYLIHYNLGMFNQMGVAYPKAGWTWDEFAQTAERVTNRGQDNLKWFGFRADSAAQFMLLTARSGPLVHYAGAGALLSLDRSATAQTVSWYAGLLRIGAFALEDGAEAGSTPQSEVTWDGVPPKDAAMWIAPEPLPSLSELRLSGIGAVPFPVDPALPQTNPIQVLDAYAISASTTQPAAAWQWLQYLLEHRPLDPRHYTGVAAQRALLPAFGRQIDEEAQQTYRYALEHARQVDALRPEVYSVRKALEDALLSIFRGEKDVPAALQGAQSLVESQIRR